ncbi:MAG: HAD family hydrolase [Saprospiraceae bacterium]|nr:HAD family hydrolase [Saprospiraceae bacterium]
MMKYKLIIFDCDGTLVDSEPVSNKVVSDMINELGIPMTPEKSIALFAGTQFSNIVNYIHRFQPEVSAQNFEGQFRERSKVAFEKFLTPIAGVVDFIESLDIPYCVASNGPRLKMETTLSVTNLKAYFGGNIFSAYDIESWKPEPDLFLYAAEKMGFKAEETLVIEDTISGLDAAVNAEMDCAIFSDNGSVSEFEGKAKYIFNHFNELPSVLDRI